jgi:hypothetical protein
MKFTVKSRLARIPGWLQGLCDLQFSLGPFNPLGYTGIFADNLNHFLFGV